MSVCLYADHSLSLCLYLLDVDLNGIDAGVQCTSRCRCDKHHTIFWSSSACLRQSLTINTSGLDTCCWISFIHRVSTLETHAVSVNLASWLHWQRLGIISAFGAQNILNTNAVRTYCNVTCCLCSRYLGFVTYNVNVTKCQAFSKLSRWGRRTVTVFWWYALA